MDTVVLVLMLLTAFNFLLKQTFWKLIAVGIIAAICAVFAGLMWPYAIEQSKTQIANWLSNQPLMLDTSVLLSVEVCIQMAYAMTNALVAVLGIVATVNGKTSAAGVSEIDWKALTGVIVIALAGGILGLLWWNIRNRNKEKSVKQ